MSLKDSISGKPWHEHVNEVLTEYNKKCKVKGFNYSYDVPNDAYAGKLSAQEFRKKYKFSANSCIPAKNKRDAERDKHNRFYEKIYDKQSCNYVDGFWDEATANRKTKFGKGVCWVRPVDQTCGAHGVNAAIQNRKDLNLDPLMRAAEKKCNAHSDCAWAKLPGQPIDCVRKDLTKVKRGLVDKPPSSMPEDVTNPENKSEQWLFDWYMKKMHGPSPETKELFGTGDRCNPAKAAATASPNERPEYDLITKGDLLAFAMEPQVRQLLEMIQYDQGVNETMKKIKELRALKDKAVVAAKLAEMRKSIEDAYIDYMRQESVGDEEDPSKKFLPSIPQSVVNMVMKNIAIKGSSNRGLMALHSTGSGKTCTATGVIDAFWDTDRQIIFASSIDAVASNPPFKFHECATRLYARFKREPYLGVDEAESMKLVGDAFDERGVIFLPFAKLANRIVKTEEFKSAIKKSTAKKSAVSGKVSKFVERLMRVYDRDEKVISAALSKAKISNREDFVDLDNAVLVVDEVHNLFRPLPNQKAKHKLVEKHIIDPAVHPSLKVVILTATPGDNAEDVVKLLNIVRDPTHKAIVAPDVDSIESLEKFKQSIRGMISFFDMSSDTTQFPVVNDIGPIKYPMSNKQFERYIEAYKEVKEGMTNYDKLAKANQLAKFWAGPRKYSNMLYNFEKGMAQTEFSSKLPALLEKIKAYASEKHYIYSAFYENRGSSQGILEVARQLEQMGYKKLTVKEAKEYNRKGVMPEKAKRYVLALQKDLGGEGTSSAGMNLSELIKIFNHKNNKNGELVNVFLATQGFNEGIDLKAVRHIHIFEPLVTMASDLQTIGRARRYCSHADLEWPNQWTVMIHRYLSDMPIQTSFHSIEALKGHVAHLELELSSLTDKKEIAAKKKEIKEASSKMKKAEKDDTSKIQNIDEFIYNNAIEKMKQLFVLHQCIKESALDCRLLHKFHKLDAKCVA